MLLSNGIFTRNISFTECHKIVYVISSIAHEASNRRICHLFISNNDRTHVQIDLLLDILHFTIHWQLQPSEDTRDHFCTHEIMIMKGPSSGWIPPFTFCLTYIMQQSSPSQPQIIGMFADIIKHLQRMIEVIFMCPTILCLNNIKCNKLRKDKLQKPTTI